MRGKAERDDVWNVGSGWARLGWGRRHRNLSATPTVGFPHLSASSHKWGEASPLSTSFMGSTRPGTHPSAGRCWPEWT